MAEVRTAKEFLPLDTLVQGQHVCTREELEEAHFPLDRIDQSERTRLKCIEMGLVGESREEPGHFHVTLLGMIHAGCGYGGLN